MTEPLILPTGELKLHLHQILESVRKEGAMYVVTRGNIPIARIIPLEDKP